MSISFSASSPDVAPRRGLLAALLERRFSGFEHGALALDAPDGALLHLHGRTEGPNAHIHIARRRAILRALVGGEHGAAKAFIDGDWTSADLTETCRFFDRNRAASTPAALGRAQAGFERLRRAMRANTRAGSRRNIEFHYDLGNDFFRLWLDPNMSYSSALWRQPDETLEQAQVNKFDRIADLAGVGDGASVLEIGCGWGAQARMLAQRGAHVKGVTLSPSQLGFARELIASAGVRDRVSLCLEDYRDQAGQYDAIVSIEMAEAVGEEFLPGYFETIRRNLKPGGRAVLQIITISEDRMDGYRRNPDFIQKHIFPGGFLPSRDMLRRLAADEGLSIELAESFGSSYARTLAEWRARFEDAWPAIERQGFDARFRRMWNYYLSYCEAGFLEGAIDVGLFVLTKAGDHTSATRP
jgi:cyclopropane-fatty-acyl-phospholipid synthase